MSYHVVAADRGRRLGQFLALPSRLYRDDPNWVPPVTAEIRRTLSTRKNPYFRRASRTLLLCTRHGQAVARAAVVIDPLHWERYGKRTAFFGFFESTRDPQAAHCVLEAAAARAAERGAELLEGPFSPNHYSELGLRTDGFERPAAFFEPCNPDYYPDLLTSNGFTVTRRLHTRRNPDVSRTVRDRLGAREPIRGRWGLTARTFNGRDFRGDLERIREVFNDAFAANWHFLPLSREEYLFSARHLGLVSTPEMITIIERRGEPVGVLQMALDINPALRCLGGRLGPLRLLRFLRERKRTRDLLIFAVGVKERFQRHYVLKLIFDRVCETARTCRSLATTWIDEGNRNVVTAAERLDLVPDRHLAIYARPLEAHHA